MKDRLPLFIMLGGCGWQTLQQHRFARTIAPIQKRIETVFGPDSAGLASIVSGRWPEEHRTWCRYAYGPEQSPFRELRWLRWLPQAISGRPIVRRLLTPRFQRRLGFHGPFDLGNFPFRRLPLLDFTEKKNMLRPGGMNVGKSIFDDLSRKGVPYFATDTKRSEKANRNSLIARIQGEEIDFAFQYFGGLEPLLQRAGNGSRSIGRQLETYEEWIGQILAAATGHYREVALYVFGDHGLADCRQRLDLRSKIDALGLRFGEDYAVIYDATMARFWFLNEGARVRVERVLSDVHEGRVLPDGELEQMRTLFPDRYFGELIFLAREGVLLSPNDVSPASVRAVHGYHPSEPHSAGALLTNQPALPGTITAIPHLYQVMTEEIQKVRSGPSRRLVSGPPAAAPVPEPLRFAFR